MPGDEAAQNREGVFSRLFYRPAEENEAVNSNTKHYSEEEIGFGGTGDFTVERAVEIIDDLPRDVPRNSARKIVVHTLKAAGIEVRDIIDSSREREDELESEIDQGEERIQELQSSTDEIIRSLRLEIDQARENCDDNVQSERDRIERMQNSLSNLGRVRTFFGLEEGESTQILSDPNKTGNLSVGPADDYLESQDPEDHRS